MIELGRRAALVAACLAWVTSLAWAQLADGIVEFDHPAIGYSRGATTDAVALLNQRLSKGETSFAFDNRTGYLRSVLEALRIPAESQVAVFSKTSLQSSRITPKNPRTIFFNDSTIVAWVRGGFIEVATQDPRQGTVFYVLPQSPLPPGGPHPMFLRQTDCLTCHYARATLGVPGVLLRSVATGADGRAMPWAANYVTTHRSPLEQRWAGWYVSGKFGAARHLGNAVAADSRAQDVPIVATNLNVASLDDRFDTAAFVTPHSDAAALLVLDHQMHMMNLITRIGWEARVLAHEGRPQTGLAGAAAEVVDYLLFVEEAPLPAVSGTSGFAERFSALGPRDRRGRSLRDLALNRRLMRYPCSYMIYSEAFEALPPAAKDAIYRRLWDVLSGRENGTKYARLTAADRQAIVEILRETKRDLPEYWRGPT